MLEIVQSNNDYQCPISIYIPHVRKITKLEITTSTQAIKNCKVKFLNGIFNSNKNIT